MKSTQRNSMIVVLIALATLAFSAGACLAQTPEAAPAPEFTPERITGRIVNTVGGGSLPFTLQINNLTTDEEIVALRGLLAEKGDDDVVKAMEKMDKDGWLRIGDDLRVNVAVIRAFPTEKGWVIRVVSNRSLLFTEEMRASRSRKYPFGIVELMLDEKGAGEGTVFVAARFKFNKEGVLEVESYGIAPVQVLNLQAKPHGE